MSCEEELIELKKINSKLLKTNQQLEQKLLELYTLYSISRELTDATELEEMLNATMQIMKDTLGIDGFVVYLKDDLSDFFVLQSVYGIDPEKIQNIRISPNEEIIKELSEKNKIMVDLSENNIPILSPDLIKKGKMLLLSFRNLEMVGFIGILRSSREFENHEWEFFENMSEQLTKAIEKFLHQKKVQDMIIIDTETGLYNRKFFFEAMKREWERARRYKRFMSLMIIKVNNFNEFFSKHGSNLSEALLRSIAQTLSANIRFSDIIARFGIDEFAIILPETNSEKAEKAARKILNILEKKRFLGESEMGENGVTFSIGIASYPESGEEPLKILNSAIEATRLAQKGGPGKIIVA